MLEESMKTVKMQIHFSIVFSRDRDFSGLHPSYPCRTGMPERQTNAILMTVKKRSNSGRVQCFVYQ
jgi:hypothetical protein